MIKLFRNIRQTLIMENKTSKYLKYAIGEIVLVVIGILIALQINNWNENNKQLSNEKQLLQEMQLSIKKDTANFAWEKVWLSQINTHAKRLKKHLADKNPYEQSLDTSFAMIGVITILEPSYLIYDRLKDFGIDNLSRDSLKIKIATYYEDAIQMKQVERTFALDKIFRENIYPKYFKNYSYATTAQPINYDALIEENEFLIYLDYVINDSRFHNRRSQKKSKNAVAVLKELEQYFN